MLRFAFKPRHPITRVAFTADGQEIITAQPHTSIAVRDRLTGAARVTVPTLSTTTFFALAVEPITGLVATHTERGSLMYDSRTGQPTHPVFQPDFPEPGNRFKERWESTGTNLRRLFGLRADAFSNGTRGVRVSMSAALRAELFVPDGGLPYLMCPRTGYTLAKLNSPVRLRNLIYGRAVVAFSPAGNKLALGDGNSLRIFDFTSREPRFCETDAERPLIHPLFTLERPDPTRHGTFADKQAEYWLPPVAFDHAGRTMFTLGLRNRVQRIDLATGGVMGEWGWRCEPIRSLAVAPDDLTAVAGCQRGELVVWDLE